MKNKTEVLQDDGKFRILKVTASYPPFRVIYYPQQKRGLFNQLFNQWRNITRPYAFGDEGDYEIFYDDVQGAEDCLIKLKSFMAMG